jgi:hypothetical protein
LDYVGGGKTGKSVTVEVDVLEKFYEATRAALEDAKNEVSVRNVHDSLEINASLQRLSVKTNLKLAKLWLDRKEYGRLSRVAHSAIQGNAFLNICPAHPRPTQSNIGRWRRPVSTGHSVTRNLRIGDSDVQRNEKFQEVKGA